MELKKRTIQARIRRGWDPEKARTAPLYKIEQLPQGYKRCTVCKEVKARTDFYKRKDRPGQIATHCLDCDKVRGLVRKQQLKVRVFQKYGQSCEICGMADTDVLSIDHKNFHGNKERRSYGRNLNGFYLKLLNTDKREDLRVLCRNCNWKEYINHARSKRRR